MLLLCLTTTQSLETVFIKSEYINKVYLNLLPHKAVLITLLMMLLWTYKVWIPVLLAISYILR